MNNLRAPFARTQASVLLDLVRGLAAFLVVISHARNLLFIDYNDLPAHPLWTSVFYTVTRAGHQSVVIFFVLSGYLIGGSVLRAVERRTWSWTSYLTHRLVRLWVVLLPGLLLCVIIDRIALGHHLAPSLYLTGASNHMSVDVAAHLTPAVFLQNLFFIDVLTGPVFGSNTALWSLPYEFWYYILFPLGLVTLTRTTSHRTRLITILVLVATACFTHIFLPAFPVWLAGALLAVMPIPSFGPRLGPAIRILATLAYLPLFFFTASFKSSWPALTGDYLLAVATFFFLWILLSARKQTPQSLHVRATRNLARFSYTLYIVHPPLLLLLAALTVGETRWVPSPLAFLKCTGIVAIIMLYAYLIASLTEFHTDTVRRWVEGRLLFVRKSLAGDSLMHPLVRRRE